ncbi:MAG TPA: EF-hand domain-containing protein [Candidatus Acidoferrum sp.]|nr:EF-hand domain-containing protein [Candidatus Acidoferrum sp.]
MMFKMSARAPVGFACMATLAVLAAAPAAQAQEKMTKEQAVQLVFNRFDTNKDGNITSAEFMKVGEQDFQAFDANKDGNLTKEEFLDPKPRHLGKVSDADLAQAKKVWTQQFDHLDTDKNGLLSDAEHQKAGKLSFARMDTNKDNEITLSELSAAAN